MVLRAMQWAGQLRIDWLRGEGKGAERCLFYVTRWVMGALTISERTGGGAGHRNWRGGKVGGSV